LAAGCRDDPLSRDVPAAEQTPQPATTPIVRGDSVAVRLAELNVQVADTVTAGPVAFHIANSGTVGHGFVIQGPNLEQRLDATLAPGDSAVLEVELEPGIYQVHCPVADHAERGMQTELVVVPRDATAPRP
jgi:hypothetical protein